MEDFDAYVVARSAALIRTGYLLTGDWGLAEDLVQEALAAVAARWSAVTRGGDPEPYIRKVMYHRSIDWWRRRRGVSDPIMEPSPADLGHHTAAEGEEGAVRRLMLRDALARLTARQRTVLVLRFYEDLTERETARLMGCSVNTVKSQSRHALARLRELAPDLVDAFAGAEEVEAR